MIENFLQTPIEFLKGVGPHRAELLRKEMGIRTFQDLLHLFPNRYIDRTRYYPINQLQDNLSEVQIIGQVTSLKMVDQGRKKRLVAVFADATDTMELVWFRGHKWIKESIKIGTDYVIFGKVTRFQNTFSMPHPEMELLTEHQESLRSAMQPVYPSTEKLTQSGITHRVIGKLMQQVFIDAKNAFAETLPNDIVNQFHLLPKNDALFNIHFPKNQDLLTRAIYRLKFEELFFIQIQLIQKNLIHKAKIKGLVFDKIGTYFNRFYNELLPFPLTEAQKRVIKEIRKDVAGPSQMNRLLQGDVGSGKTIVAFMAVLMALDNGFQACIMAPTEILAVQHYNTIKSWCNKLEISVFLLTGSTKTSTRKEIHENLENGSLQLLIGTHALIEDKVTFKNLGIAIIDEQHRFGVEQRAKMWHKGPRNQNNHKIIPPHILVMTATPIPRTLAMSVYGDLDISVIDELPPGRKKVKTVHRYENSRTQVFDFVKKEIAAGRQIYIVYPLISESEKLDYKDLLDGYDTVSRYFPLPEYQISIVHGQHKPEDKEYEMQRFIQGITQIMLATTVIEVGVDVPNASVMIIESAERFGLSQLHQLRGRVGRGAEQSYCILLTSHQLSADAKTRIETMVRTDDGFEIAETDLKLRGPGDVMGTQQSGVLRLKIADITKDHAILKLARNTAWQILKKDPSLQQPANHALKVALTHLAKYKNSWSYIS